MPADLFYHYYDILFPKKDYAAETEAVISISGKYGVKNPRRIVEIGCGTGSHTIELSKRVSRLFACDIDGEMISKAEEKLKAAGIKNVELFGGPLSASPERTYDLALALFNVVTYIDREEELGELFSSVRSRLRPGGLFIFDCWNGLAAMLDPPKGKKTEVKSGKEVISCDLSSSTDFILQKTVLTYKIKKKAGDGTSEEGSTSFSQTLWTPMQIRSCLRRSGLEELECCRIFESGKPATEKDWKIMFVCRNPV